MTTITTDQPAKRKPSDCDTSNVHPRLPADVRLAVDTLAIFVNSAAAQPGVDGAPVRFKVHELIAALNKLA